MFSPPVFISDELPHYIRTMEADLLYYEDIQDISPPRENMKRILKDWGAASMKMKKNHNRNSKSNQNSNNNRSGITNIPNDDQHRIVTVTENPRSSSLASYRRGGSSSLRQRISKGGNLWQHKLKRVENHPNFKLLPMMMTDFYSGLPSYQKFQYLK